MTATRPGLSVVILTFNSSRTLEQCLRSVAKQTRPPLEVLLVDDNSTDSTVPLARTVAADEGLNLRVLTNGAHNISRGRNIGIEAASSPLVAFLDSDAYAAPEWCEAIQDALLAPEHPAVVGGAVETAHGTRFAQALASNDGVVKDLFGRGAQLISGCNMAVNRDLVGGHLFDPHWVHAEDVEFVQRICPPQTWALAPEALVRHESRATPKAYLRQMFRYGAWKVRYARHTGDHRLIDYVPSVLMLLSLALAPWQPLALLGLPAFCAAESLFVLVVRRAPARMAPRIFLGWLVKNVGWGTGVLMGLRAAPQGI
jgi:glycosyltransferase involved in cell wall biosynthesis